MKKTKPVKVRYYPGRKRCVSVRMTREAAEMLHTLLFTAVAGEPWFNSEASSIDFELRLAIPDLKPVSGLTLKGGAGCYTIFERKEPK